MYRPGELETYQIVADPTLSPDEKQARMAALYETPPPDAGPLASAPPPTPDARMASNDSAADDLAFLEQHGHGYADPTAPPQPPPTAADVGPNMSVAPPMSMPGAPAPAAPPAPGTGQGAPAAPPPSVDDQAAAAARGIIAASIRGTPGHVVAAHDQPVSTTVEKKEPIPEELKERIATGEAAQAGLKLKEGDLEEQNAIKNELVASESADKAQADFDQFKKMHAAEQKRMTDIDNEYQNMVKESAIEPDAWWTSKSTGGQIMTILGAVGMGLIGGPKMLHDMLQSQIKQDMDVRIGERDKRLGAFREKMKDVQGRLLSPEAAANMEMALGNRVAAAQAKQLEASAQSPEVRLKYQQAAQAMMTEAAKYEANMAAQEAGASRTQIAHVARQVVGGSSVLQNLKRVNEALGTKGTETLGILAGGALPGGKEEKTDIERRVIFPDGAVGYAGSGGEADRMKTGVSAIGGLREGLSQIRRLASAPGHTIAGADKARIEANVAANLSTMLADAKSEGGGIRMSPEMIDKLQSLIGGRALETSTAGGTLNANIDEAMRILDAQESRMRSVVTPAPNTKVSGGKIETLGKNVTRTAADLGAEKE